MADPIPASVRKLWNDWNIRGVMLFSLLMQTFLILFSPMRKGTSNKLIIMLLWTAYLLADWAANFAVGLISDSQGDELQSSSSAPSPPPSENSDLLAFWPPFLLLHLGGPDTITAFALEDNELWIRHLLGLIFQAVAALYVFLQSLPETRLVAPTIMMFLAGTIKYLERTRALYLASLESFRDSMLKEPDPGPNYAKLMDEYSSKIDAKLPAKIITIEEPEKEFKAVDAAGAQNKLNNVEVVQKAYKYFNIFKGLIVDLIFSFHERDESRDFFKRLIPEDVLRVIEVELNFVYDVFYTKIRVVHSVIGYIMRFTSFGLVVASLSVFNFHVKRQFYDNFDVKITYILFWGAIGLDAVAFFMLLFSDWTFAALEISENESKFKSSIKSSIVYLLSWFLDFKKPRWRKCQKHLPGSKMHKVLATPLLFRRWSGHISGHNLVRYCLKLRPIRTHRAKNCVQLALDYLGINKFIKAVGKSMSMVSQFLGWIVSSTIKVLGFISGHVSHCLFYSCGRIPFLSHIWGEIIQFLGFILRKIVHFLGIDSIEVPVFVDEIRYASHEPLPEKLWEFILDQLKEKSKAVAQSKDPEVAKKVSSARGDGVLKDEAYSAICKKFIPYLSDVAYDESLLFWHIATELLYFTEDSQVISGTGEKCIPHCDFSKLLSDYMLYLMVMQPGIMSAVAGIGKIRFRDTCEEAKRFFKTKDLRSEGSPEKTACEKILAVNTHVKPELVKGDRSKSALFDASMLAKELKTLKQEERWELMSKIWVELLSYAACNCDAKTHAQQVSKGGELITFVWLLMAHLGLGDQFQINKGQGRAKLIVGK